MIETFFDTNKTSLGTSWQVTDLRITNAKDPQNMILQDIYNTFVTCMIYAVRNFIVPRALLKQ